ncbi:hypothetical protein [Marinobacter salsuginis]|uniref:Uncharacterized protein n=1 Tax=Marinobacter salsuginis TaxID=418719 RepID=A0A5M3Q250_9GAMM|nr:hypothetical protein [Marinobacter salsuginis]GBO89206.1 hypothetical protein MSSD14B_28740 [Marinobacter salsuginis]
MNNTSERLQHFDRALKTVAAHFSRYGREGRVAPVTRTLECAFETDSQFSDALAASLMLKAEKSPALKAGLNGWKVWESQVWLDGAKVHEGRSLSEIRTSLTPAGESA